MVNLFEMERRGIPFNNADSAEAVGGRDYEMDRIENARKPTAIESAMDTLKAAMQEDSDYAHGWHCNIAMACYDSMSKGTEEADDSESYKNRNAISNEAASRFMKLCFGVVTKQ